MWEKKLPSDEYQKLQRDLSILANARSELQFQEWVTYLLERWKFRPDVFSYLTPKCDSSRWESRFYWGAGGIAGLGNSRTNNSVESFHRSVRNTWLNRSLSSLARLIGILKGPQMQMESRKGSTLTEFNPYDKEAFYHEKFNSSWIEAMELKRTG